ncbi:MAG: sigma-70 family RNA polymerase sigma factor [Candidatus Acidiferrales bacterium]|jgi:RNA polymerase sigma-70 factor (ECF subfamily)
MPPKTDARERLLIEAAQKDPARFTELYEENFERVYAFVSRRVHLRADAEDLTAEVFQHALENLARFEWRGVPFAAWLYRIAANAVADRWQRVSHESGKPAAEVASAHFDDSEIERAEWRAQLFRNVANLPAEQRRVIEMRFAEEKSIREIAKELGRSTGAVKQLQFRAFQKLREQVTEEFRNRPGGRNG